ncbi:hypothetical protein HDV05_000289, partial [Chytridiales sp. JEL 0842]
ATKIVAENQVLRQNASELVLEVFKNIRTVFAFGEEKQEVSQFSSILSSIRALSHRHAKLVAIATAVTASLFIMLQTPIFYVSGLLVIQRNLTASDVMNVILQIGSALSMLSIVIGQVPVLLEAGTLAQKILDIIELDIQESINAQTAEMELTGVVSSNSSNLLHSLKGDILFENVTFAYPTRPSISVLQNFNLHIRSGTTVGLVGTSGCGKTSIMQLILGLYQFQSGNLHMDGIKIQDIDIHLLRQNIGVVSQEPSLFPGTIAENISLGALDHDVKMDDIKKVARTIFAHEFIEKLPLGYNTLVNNVKLSGGQKQLIVIARALIRNPKILLLDEATSAMDNQSEQLVRRALDVICKNRTTIVIAHRLSTVKNADVIYVLHNGGNIVEKGTHEELMNMRSAYYKMVEGQKIDSGKDDVAEPTVEAEHVDVQGGNDSKILKEVVLSENMGDEERDIETVFDRASKRRKGLFACWLPQIDNEKPEKGQDSVSLWKLFLLRASKSYKAYLIIGLIGSVISAS